MEKNGFTKMPDGTQGLSEDQKLAFEQIYEAKRRKKAVREYLKEKGVPSEVRWKRVQRLEKRGLSTEEMIFEAIRMCSHEPLEE